MLSLLLIAAMPLAEDPTFERMLLCKAYHEQWQWDERKAGRKVPDDVYSWAMPFRKKLYAAGAAEGLSRDQVKARANQIAFELRAAAGLSPEQNADWAKCRKELDWAPDPGGKMID